MQIVKERKKARVTMTFSISLMVLRSITSIHGQIWPKNKSWGAKLVFLKVEGPNWSLEQSWRTKLSILPKINARDPNKQGTPMLVDCREYNTLMLWLCQWWFIYLLPKLCLCSVAHSDVGGYFLLLFCYYFVKHSFVGMTMGWVRCG